MDYENYIELYEAIYFFDKLKLSNEKNTLDISNNDIIKKTGLNESIYISMLRILVVNDLLEFDGNNFYLTEENVERQKHILDNIINKDPNKQYLDLFEKATNDSQFFFENITEHEYEIYSRYNFGITYKTGNEVKKHLDLNNKKVLELGGNSGGLASALVKDNENCLYTILDRKIPCRVGKEFSKLNENDINFIEGNAFNLLLEKENYDYILMMNLLHDFDDAKCLRILENCKKYCNEETKFIIIEDILTNEFEPKEVVMHGLRLSVECRGGKQRKVNEFESIFSSINYKVINTLDISNVHKMIVLESKK